MNKEFKPYYAVIFTSTRTEGDNGYNEMSELIETLAKKQDGFIGVDSARNNTSTALSGAVGITVSYWENLEAIKSWKQQSEHLLAQQKGRNEWYNWYNVRICKVEREYKFLRKQESHE